MVLFSILTIIKIKLFQAGIITQTTPFLIHPQVTTLSSHTILLFYCLDKSSSQYISPSSPANCTRIILSIFSLFPLVYASASADLSLQALISLFPALTYRFLLH